MIDDVLCMQRALELAQRGEGRVEPNPMVGTLVVKDGQIVGQGYHQQYGGPHAEVHALADAGEAARGATLYVTLEPCCHAGKTPPCTDAILRAGIRRVVVAAGDPFPQVDGGGIARLEAAGLRCEVGLLETEARRLLAPYLKLVNTGQPWVIAKWAMTLDGKLATRTGSSQWITNTAARRRVHQLRGRMDAIVVGAGTARTDDPLLTARPPGPRVATRIVLGDLSADSQLARTLSDAPVIVVRTSSPPPQQYDWLTNNGGELLVLPNADRTACIEQLLIELGQRRMTNVLFEGGSQVLGTLLDANAIDEVHAYLAPKLVGGRDAPGPVAGQGIAEMASALELADVAMEPIGDNLLVTGRRPLPAIRP